MKIVTTRRISQVFFFLLFLWFCVVSTVGEKFWQLGGWCVNWFLHLDPLVALGTILTTHSLYRSLVWALVTVVLTIILGRFFCGWVCPFGSLHHFVGYLGNRKKSAAENVRLNRYRKGQSVKYFVLIFFLGMAAVGKLGGSLQVGLLDPISLVSRSFNLVLVPIFDKGFGFISAAGRNYEGAWLILTVFLAAVFLNLLIPRFYCRFVCPLGALFGVLGRFAILRIGKSEKKCTNCKLCEKSCEGGCEPSGEIRISECVLCFNCREDCKDEFVFYQTQKSAGGELGADIGRRGFLLSLGSGLLMVPAVRLGKRIGSNWYHKIIRPPGSLAEAEFLKRCIKCGQCIRVCPTNVIQPAGIEGGVENLWTPVLNNRIGSSGCQLNCVACGEVCPTSAIRPITLSEKLGEGEFAEAGPIKLGTAFIDRSRCLPWAMGKPCIVCEENCPVSPKAIYTQEYFSTIREGILKVSKANSEMIELAGGGLVAEKYGSGDYYVAAGGQRVKILGNTEKTIEIFGEESAWEKPAKNSIITIQVRLQGPWVDIEKCIGCGVCEHECPVSGKKAIRVSAEGETRSKDRGLLLKG